MSSMSALCKICLYYTHGDKTCGRSLVAAGKGRVYHDYAKAVRTDPKRCGPDGRWFLETYGKDGLTHHMSNKANNQADIAIQHHMEDTVPYFE
jgi:hypothetical protein